MFKGASKKFLSSFLALIMVLSVVSTANAADITRSSSEAYIPSHDEINASSNDPLMSVVTVTTGGDASSFVDIDSTYTPSGYTTRSTGTSGYTNAPGNDFSYHTSRNGTTSNSYIITPTDDLSWSKNNANDGVTGAISSTAVSDYKATQYIFIKENGALCAKVNSKVLQIHALSDINVTFDFSSNLTINKSAGKGNIMEGVYTLKTTSASPTIAQIKAGTVRSNTNKSDNSLTVNATGSVSESIS